MDRNSDDAGEGRISTDRETIRRWADDHGAVPVREGGGDADAEYRIVREDDVGTSHERAEWDDFFAQLDDGDRVVVYDESHADEPFQMIRRDELVAQTELAEEELQERLIEGETVTSEVTETTVVESVVVEEATIESKLVDTELLEQRVVDVELVSRECSGCELIETGERDDRAWFDEDRYVSSVGTPGSGRMVGGGESTAATGPGAEGAEATPTESGMDPERDQPDEELDRSSEATRTDDPGVRALESTDDVPYSSAFDVEEAWSVTREFLERFTVESRVSGTDVSETESVADRDIDVEGLHQSIAQSGLLDLDLSSEEVLSNCTIQTEFNEDDMIRTHFEREHVVEDEVVDRKHLEASVTGGDLREMEVVRSQELASQVEGERGAGAGEAEMVDADATGEAGMADTEGEAAGRTDPERAEAAAGTASAGSVTLTDDEVGKTVVDATGDEVGMVAAIEEHGEVMRVDAHPGLTDRIKAALDWGDAGEEEYPVEIDQVARVTDDQVELKGAEDLEASER